MIPKHQIDQVIETANAHIVDVVSDYVQLRKRGANYVGCCPFHTEKTPSFSVSPAKGYYYCFGCHKGGSAVNIVTELEKLSFPDAIKYLGRRFGIEVEEEMPSPEALAEVKEREALFTVMEYATRQFEANLKENAEGQAMGMGYLRHRGFRDDTIATFRLGYSLSQRDALLNRALTEGYKEEILLKAGLISVSEGGAKSDRFKGRVIFPIQNAAGKVIGFGGRVLDTRTKGVMVKYLNTPETELYVKSDIVYGIYQARTEMSRADKCYLVEGYTDVISMHQSGIKNVVASSGTALTINQIRLIKRFTNNITVLYDGDSAGIHASLRGIDMILHEGMNVRVLLLPDGEDPDSFAMSRTPEEFLKYVEEHETDFISFEAESLMQSVGNDPIRKAEATHTIVNSIAEVQDLIKREEFVRRCSRIMGVSEGALFGELQKRLTSNAIRQRDWDIAQQRRRDFEARVAPQPSVAQQTNQAPLPSPEPLPDDLSPQEFAFLQSRGLLKAPPPQPKHPTAARQELEFREVMRYFVTYPQHKLWRYEGTPTVADFIVNSLRADSLESSEPVLTKLVEIYENAQDRTAVDVSYFLNYSDTEVSSFVAGAIGGRPELSKIHSRYVAIAGEEEQLDYLVPRAIDELRMNRIVRMIENVKQQIGELEKDPNASEEDLTRLMKEYSDLSEVKREFSLEMGERAVIR